MVMRGSMKVERRFKSDEEKIPSTTTLGAEMAAKDDLPMNQRIRDGPASLTCVPSELGEADILENAEWRPKQFAREIMNETACHQALIDEVNEWEERILKMNRILDSIANHTEKPTIDGESSPALPVEAVNAAEPSSNQYSILSDEDSPQEDETIDVQPEKQLEEPREEPVPAHQTIAAWGDNPGELTWFISPQVGEKLEEKPETQFDIPPPSRQIESRIGCVREVPAEHPIPITGDKPQTGDQSLDELMRLRELHEVNRMTQLEEPWPDKQLESIIGCLEEVPAEQSIPNTGDKPQKGDRSLRGIPYWRKLLEDHVKEPRARKQWKAFGLKVGNKTKQTTGRYGQTSNIKRELVTFRKRLASGHMRRRRKTPECHSHRCPRGSPRWPI